MKVHRTAKDIKLAACFTVPVAPGMHQKTENSAHLIAELGSSAWASSGLRGKPVVSRTVPAHRWVLGLLHLFSQETVRTENRRVANFLQSSIFAFSYAYFNPCFSLVRDSQNILNLILGIANAVRACSS